MSDLAAPPDDRTTAASTPRWPSDDGRSRRLWPRRVPADDDRRPGRPRRAGPRGPGRQVPRRPPRRWRVVLWRARLPVAAVLVGCAAVLALADLRPAPPPRTPVVVAARALDAGTPLTAGDLAIARLPPDAVADGAHADADDVVGRAVVVAVPAGLTVVDALLRDDRLGSSGPPGTVVVPVRLADPGVADLLRPGDRVDLFATATSAAGAPVAERLAQRALVLPLPAPPADASAGGLLGPATQDGGTLTLVAVAPDGAAALAAASGWAGISAVVVE